MSIFSLTYERDFKVVKTLGNERNPFVVIVGWISSTEKNLKKYAEWYVSNGFDVISFTPKDSYHCFPSYMEQLAQDLLKFINENFKDRNMVFHCFSGNMICYSYIVQHIEKV